MDPRLQKLHNWAEKDLHENLLPWWTKHVMGDPRGFYGSVSAEGVPDPEADRFIVMSARLLWTYSAAYRVSKREEYKALADKAYKAFTQWFHDDVYGGFYTQVDKAGKPVKDYKLVYGNAFAIYGLSEYVRVTGDKEARRLAEETVSRLDEHIYDPRHMGYYETAARDWAWTPTVMGMNHGGLDCQKTMNTHLHLIEAYTNLLRVSESAALRSRVREMLYIFLNLITNRVTHHFHVYQDRAWKPVSTEQSFGHDIEGSWLLTEAADVLGEAEAVRDARAVCMNIARAVYDDGFCESGLLLTEYEPLTREYVPRYSWWEQNEAIVGCVNAWQITGEEKFLDRAAATMEAADKYFIDRKLGGWYHRLDGSKTPVAGVEKANGFICPYHNARMHLEILERVEHIASK